MKKTPGLFDFQKRMEELSEKSDPLERLYFIDWEIFRPLLRKIIKKVPGEAGRNPYDEILKFKILVLQRLYDLSDEQTEFQIKDRLSFMRFLGLELHDDVPDENTIRNFKEKLIEMKLMKKLFNRFNRELEGRGLMLKQGSIVDASFVEVPRQRNNREENKIIKEGGVPPEWDTNQNKMAQKDVDARWTKKNGQNYYGYKNHIRIDVAGKFVEDYAVTAASVHDSQAASEIIKGAADDIPLYGDSAYNTQEIRKLIEKKRMKNKIIDRRYRNRPLTAAQNRRNQICSKVRARIEHVFGDAEKFGGDFIRTIGKRRAEFQIGLINLVYNMRRFAFVTG